MNTSASSTPDTPPASGAKDSVPVRGTCPFHFTKRVAGAPSTRSRMMGVSMLLIACGVAFVLWQLYRQQTALSESMALPFPAATAILGIGLVGFGFAVRRMRRTSESLRQSEERLRATIGAALDAVVTMDAAGLITDWNPQAEKSFGWTRQEAVGRSLSGTIIPTQFREAHDRGLKHFLTSGEGPVLNKRIEITALRRDGSEFPIELAIAPLITGQAHSFSAFIRDITERRQREAELLATQKDLLKASRQAGMAEMATGVLHNVGNVLNSVNVASTCIADGIRKSKATSLAKVVDLLRSHESDLGEFFANDPKGKQIPGYLAQLSDHLAGERATTLKELTELQQHIDHIKEIVTTQQSFAKVSGLSEILNVTDLVEEALRLNHASLAAHRMEIIREFADVPPITVEKHKALQILVNLVQNAKQACKMADRDEKQMTLRIMSDQERVRISVSDNGVGIPAENLKRIFNHGFTTKKTGHGFGLHNAANAAREMGGDLHVSSEGDGEGATFTLELPVSPGKS